MANYGAFRYGEAQYNGAAGAVVLVAPVIVDNRTISPGIYDLRSLAVARRGVIIENLIQGDDWRIQRTYDNLETGLTFSTWYLTIKSSATEADPGDIQKSITSTAGASGQITDTNSTGGSVAGYFVVPDTETDNLTIDQKYYYDICGITDTGAVYTFETGILYPRRGFTDAVA